MGQENKLNNDKTKNYSYLVVILYQHDLATPTDNLSLSNTDVEFSGTVRNLGFIFDSDLSMKQHIIKNV